MQDARVKIIGKLKEDLKANFIEALDCNNLNNNELILLCDYSEFVIPIGYCFTEIIRQNGSVFSAKIILRNVSQQLFFPLEEIPHGWKTVCKYEFVEGAIPNEVQELPILGGWTHFDRYLIFK
ncbi:hypothetical protein GO495_21595 [Chitinophaga oryziterrae]|uniref:Uncharacterized protein n=1 Tax=Chitinophaga oryziterrae TaxID=1031224 RepID=A0A6N8JFW5_9BACT|nr:hypothetical protein [Chitinophaga oryziterrae]MVT43206.1 hypothetical protein [Chitinophaga oryziterrae]